MFCLCLLLPIWSWENYLASHASSVQWGFKQRALTTCGLLGESSEINTCEILRTLSDTWCSMNLRHFDIKTVLPKGWYPGCYLSDIQTLCLTIFMFASLWLKESVLYFVYFCYISSLFLLKYCFIDETFLFLKNFKHTDNYRKSREHSHVHYTKR